MSKLIKIATHLLMPYLILFLQIIVLDYCLQQYIPLQWQNAFIAVFYIIIGMMIAGYLFMTFQEKQDNEVLMGVVILHLFLLIVGYGTQYFIQLPIVITMILDSSMTYSMFGFLIINLLVLNQNKNRKEKRFSYY